MNSFPLVTVAIPAYNSRFLRIALESVVAQSYGDIEIIVCDDSSDGQIEEEVQALGDRSSLPVRYVRNRQRLGFARNLLHCLELAQGKYIKFLCDDDRLLSECINLQVQALEGCADASMVIAQRLMCDVNDTPLPSRMDNCVIAAGSCVINGGDLLEILEPGVPNMFGGISHSLMKRQLVAEFLPALVQDGQGFSAQLGLALYICMLRRGHLVSLGDVLSIERLHPGRLSHQAQMHIAAKAEKDWLVQMVQARGSDPAPAPGWVRYVQLCDYSTAEPLVWQEYELQRLFYAQLANFRQEVGSDSQSFQELYADWLSCKALSPTQEMLLPKRMAGWPSQPRLLVVVIDDEDAGIELSRTLASLDRQSFAAARIITPSKAVQSLVPTAGVVTLPLEDSVPAQLDQLLRQYEDIDWVLFLEAGDQLHRHALAIIAERIVFRPQISCLYCDEGGLDGGDSVLPIFKPAFNLDLMRSFPYVGRVLAFSRDRAIEAGGLDTAFGALAPHDLLWRMVEALGTHTVGHIAELLVQATGDYSRWLALPEVIAQAPAVLAAHLRRIGVQATLEATPQSVFQRIHYQLARQPLVSIVIASTGDVETLQACVHSVLEHTAYFNYELLLIQRGVDDPAAAWLNAISSIAAGRIRVAVVEGGASPVQALNQGSEHANGEYLLFLDSHCLVFNGEWLEELLNHAGRPEVGVTGAKICTKDGTVLHAGLILGLHGPAGSPFAGQPVQAGGYMNRLLVAHDCSAVSGQCLMVRREVFERAGGFDAQTYTDELHDVDLCLRVRQEGYVVVWTPFSLVALLPPRQHLPSSRLEHEHEQAKAQFARRWLPELANDPAYNPNLSLKMASFNLNPGLRAGWDPFIARALPSVLALPVNTSAVGHYRVAQPFTELERAGWIQGRINYVTPELIELEREQPDVIILQCRYARGSMQEFDRIKAHSLARRIYELDDYIIDVPAKNAHARNMPKDMRELVKYGISRCDRVVVSTQPLADALSSMHDDIRVVPNMLASQLWRGLKSKRQTTAKPRIGWGGGTSHRGDLELIADVVRILADEVDWVFFGMCPELLRPYIKEFHPGVGLDLYPRKLASLNLDLALAPLERNLFNDCKSNLRLLEYGACGFPVICTDTKAYGGYLPCTRVASNSTEEWLDAIRAHLADPDASYRLGDQLHEAVMRDYVLTADNLHQWVNGWLAD